MLQEHPLRSSNCQASAGGYTTLGGGRIRDLVPKKWGPLLADVLLSRGPYLHYGSECISTLAAGPSGCRNSLSPPAARVKLQTRHRSRFFLPPPPYYYRVFEVFFPDFSFTIFRRPSSANRRLTHASLNLYALLWRLLKGVAFARPAAALQPSILRNRRKKGPDVLCIASGPRFEDRTWYHIPSGPWG